MMGGDSGSTQFAIDTYGGIGQQHAVSSSDNTIAMNNGSAAAAPVALTKGGAAPSQKGAGIITDLAVPAAFIFARKALTSRRLPGFSRGRSSRRSRRSRR
jgi:hypothetical protein